MTPETLAIPDQLFRRIQSEFLEMPGLRLTQPQASRLWGLDRDLCGLLLARLVDAKFLMRTRDGSFVQLELSRAERTRLSWPRRSIDAGSSTSSAPAILTSSAVASRKTSTRTPLSVSALNTPTSSARTIIADAGA